MADEPLAEAGEEQEESPEQHPTTPVVADPEEEAEEEEEGQTLEEAAAEEPSAQPQGPQPPSTPEQAEARQASWDRERDRHMRELEKRDDYRYSLSNVCPLCEGHGLLYEPQSAEEAAQMRGAILAIVGETTPEELHAHPDYHRCEVCDGYGKVYTGSRVGGQEALNCPSCNGMGHTGGKAAAAPVPLPVPTAAPAAGVPPEEQARIGNDAWGRPPGHPHYGLLPAQVS